VVLSHLAPRDVVGLRASCTDARAAVAGHAWESAAAAHAWEWALPPPPLGARIGAAAVSGDDSDAAILPRDPRPPRLHHDVAGGRAVLARWRVCFPQARSVVVYDGSVSDDPHPQLTDADMAALAAGSQITRLGLLRCCNLTGAALAPFTQLTSLVLQDSRFVVDASWAAWAGRLRAVSISDSGWFTDAHLAALSGCTHVDLGSGSTFSDAGIAAHLSGRVTHLNLDVTKCDSFDGSGLRGCARLVDLRLRNRSSHGPPKALVPDALAGCAASLATLELAGVDGVDALLASRGGSAVGGLPALRRVTLSWIRSLTDAAFAGGATPALAVLAVEECARFVGGAGLGPLSALTSLYVRGCARFTGCGLTAGCTPSLQWLEVRMCPRFAADDGDGGASGVGGGGGGGIGPSLGHAQPPPSVHGAPSLPVLAGARIYYAPRLTDAWFVHTPRLTHLSLHLCHAVVGSASVATHLPALTHLTVASCDALTGAWLGAAGGGGGSTHLEALTVLKCSSLSLADALAPGPHPRLRRARFTEAVALSDELLAASLPALRVLVARDCAGIEGGPVLSGRLPVLDDLDVGRCADFTGAGLGGLPALQSLAVYECPAVAPPALAAAAAGCPALTTVYYGSSDWRGTGTSSTRSSGGGGGGDDGVETPVPLPVTPSALGPGWVAGALDEDHHRSLSHSGSAVATWTATRALRPPPAAAAGGGGGGGGGDGGGGDDDEEQQPAPPAKRARTGSSGE
jgi:hypothetical protein